MFEYVDTTSCLISTSISDPLSLTAKTYSSMNPSTGMWIFSHAAQLKQSFVSTSSGLVKKSLGPTALCRWRHDGPSSPIQPELPRPALRGLFALHQTAERFVTRENLDQVIDDTFGPSNYGPSSRAEMSLEDLEERMNNRRRMTKFTTFPEARITLDPLSSKGSYPGRSGPKPIPFDGESASDVTQQQIRESEVKAALYGMEASRDQLTPGLEAVEAFENLKRKGGDRPLRPL